MRQFNIPRMAVCLAVGAVSSVLLCISIVWSSPVLLTALLIAASALTAAALQSDKMYAWVYNIISYALGLILSFAVEIGLDFIRSLYGLRSPNEEMSYVDWFGVTVMGGLYLFAFLLGIAGSYIITLVRIRKNRAE